MFSNNSLLTHRQLKILQLYASGYDRKGIATELSYEVGTIQSDEKRITEKCSATCLTHAVAIAVKLELVSVEVPVDTKALYDSPQTLEKSKLSKNLGEYVTTTQRLEVLWLVGNGLSNREIADELLVDRDTVRYHLRNLYKDLTPLEPDLNLNSSNEAKRNCLALLSLRLRKVEGDS